MLHTLQGCLFTAAQYFQTIAFQIVVYSEDFFLSNRSQLLIFILLLLFKSRQTSAVVETVFIFEADMIAFGSAVDKRIDATAEKE